MKKKILFLLVILITLVLTISMGVQRYQSQKNEEVQKEREYLYYRQNTAFELCSNLNERKYYHGSDELRLNRIVVNLYAYNNAQSDYQLSVEEIIDYFNKEYDSDGKLAIYSIPVNINDYIKWYFDNGEDIILEFGDWFNEYLRNHEYSQYSYRKMDYAEVTDALKKYENDPSYVPPKQDE